MKISAPPMLRMCLAASLAALCAATVPNAQAATRTLRTDLSYPWINDGTASNWVEGVFPTAADDLVLNGSGQWGGFFSPTYQSIAFYGMAACYTGGTVTATLDMDMYSGTTCGWGAQNHNLSIGRNLVVGKSATGANLNGFAAINVAGNATFGGVVGSIGYLRLTNGDATIGGTLTLAAVAGSVGDLGLQGRRLQAPRLVMGVPGSASWMRLGGGTLTLTTGASNFDGAFSESGTVSLTGGATLGLGANTSFGGTPGTIGFSTPSAVSVAGLRFDSPGFVVNGSAFNLPNASTTLASSAGVTAAALNNVLSGSGTVNKAGAGTLSLNAANTLTGAITVSAGTLVAGHASALGTPASGTSVGSGGTLALPGGITIASEPLTIAGPGAAAGVGALSNGAGPNTFAGPITLAAAASIGSTAGTLTLPNTIALGANTLTFDGAGSTTVDGVVSGAGGMAKAGAGTTTLTSANTYGGTTTVGVGTLQLGVNSALPSTTATTVATGATLDLNGKTQGLASVSSSGTLALGAGGSLTLNSGTNSIGAITGSGTITVGSGASLSLTSALTNSGVNIALAGGTLNLGVLAHSIGTLTVSAASTLDFASAGSAQLTVTTLTPSAALAVTNWTAGSDHFYSTAITGAPARGLTNVAPLNSIKLGGNVASATYWSSTGNELLAASTFNYWDGPATNTTTIEGGTSTWSAGTAKWTTSTGTPNGAWTPGAIATFTGTSGTVTVNSNQNIGGLDFSGGSTWSVEGSGSLQGTAANNLLTSTAGLYPYLVVKLAGSNSWEKTGLGGFTIVGNNSFSGPLLISSGSISAGSNNALGTTAGATTLSSGTTLFFYNNVTIAEPLNLKGASLVSQKDVNTYSGPVVLTADSSIQVLANTLTLTGSVSGAKNLTLQTDGTLNANSTFGVGAGGITKTGGGNAVFNAINTYTGVTTVNAGKLVMGVNNAINAASNTFVASGATLDLNGKTQSLSSLTSSGTLALGTGGSLTLTAGTHSIGAVTGNGTITVGSGAVLTLTSALVNSGVNVVLAGGTLNLGVLTHSIGTLSLTANSTLDFSSAGNAGITAATLALGTRALNVTNWTRGGDRFYATAFTGASANVVGSAPMNQITLSGPVSYTPAMTVWQSDREINVRLDPVLRIVKTSTGGVGTFEFTMAGLSANRDAITTTAAGVAAPGIANLTGTAGTPVTITESSVPAGWPASPSAASCVDANGASNGNGNGGFGVLADRVLTVPAARMVAGANITCTFVNSLRGFGGVVFNDGGAPSGGANTGVPNDGLKNGAEAGVAGIAVTLSDCGTVVHSSTVTDGGGAWNLDVPGSVAAGSTVCVAAAVPAKSLATGANAGGTVVPDGTTATAGGVAYTYSRPLHRFGFAAPAGGTATMNFGEVPQSSFGAAGVRQSAANTPVVYAHNFVAGTGGTLALSIAGEATNPASPGSPWSGLVYADTGCTGTLQPGAAQLYPGGATTTVLQGQTVCLVVKEQVPANAESGTINQTTVKALLTFAGATPALSATYTLIDSTTVGSSALTLVKEVRNLTTNGGWSASNQARSGQTLEYRVTYTNVTAAPVTKVVVDDTVPAYTSFRSASAGTVRAALGNCTMNTPQNPVPAAAVSCAATQPAGGTGPLKWTFDGSLDPGATGELRFQVRVD